MMRWHCWLRDLSQGAVALGKPGKLEKSFELSVVDYGRFNAMAGKQYARDRVIELYILL
jgi:hypothetical protein